MPNDTKPAMAEDQEREAFEAFVAVGHFTNWQLWQEAQRQARAAIAQAAPAQTYIPVSSQPPLESGLIDLMVDGRRFTDCYFDRICDEWRKVDHCGHLIRLKRTRITHWLAAPLASKEST